MDWAALKSKHVHVAQPGAVAFDHAALLKGRADHGRCGRGRSDRDQDRFRGG